MDLQFNSKLQTALQNLGRTGEFAPSNSQDAINPVLHEYFVAEVARSIFDKRKKAALEAMKLHDNQNIINEAVKSAAATKMGGAYSLFDTQDYTCTLTTKTPSEKLDKVALKNELIRLGVDEVTVNKAFAVATTYNKPAETYTVVVKTT